MPKNGFHQLIDQICAKCGIPNPASMHRAPNFEVKGATFTLADGNAIIPDSVIVYADFGELPRQSREAALLRLLERNAQFLTLASPVYAYNPENRHVILMSALDLGKATADTVIERLETLAGLIADWRKDYFLGNEEKTASTPVASSIAHVRTHPRFAAQHEPSTATAGQSK